MQYTEMMRPQNNLSFYNISRIDDGAYQCMSFLAEPFCDMSGPFNLVVLDAAKSKRVEIDDKQKNLR